MGLKVLVVDDIAQNITSLVQAIANDDISFVPAYSGGEALKIIANEDGFDLALIDVQMPEIDGFELAQLMRGVEKTKDIPIIFITAQTSSQYVEFQGYNIGAIDFIFKPVNVRMLRSKINVFQRLKEKRLILNQKIKELEFAKKRLEVTERQAVEADLMKSAFLAHMSHEIRTPITALIGFAELLQPLCGKIPEASNYVDVILRNGKHLLELVNGILDLSKVEAGQLEIESKSVDLNAAIRETIRLLEPLASKNHVELSTEEKPNQQAWCIADPLRLNQILTNIVGNAIKFSPNGRVKIEVSNHGKTITNSHLRVTVTDTGIGVSTHDQQKLFKPFSQVNPISDGITLGTGLGLTLSKKLANLMNGDVYLEHSEPNKGSTFVIELDSDDQQQASKHDEMASTPQGKNETPLSGLHILLADDSPDNRTLLEAFLEVFGATSKSTENGEEAVDALAKDNFNLVLMDFKMPILDGLSATKKLRENGATIPIILLTANAMKGEREAALKAGANDYISKPINWDELVSKVQQCVPKPAARMPGAMH